MEKKVIDLDNIRRVGQGIETILRLQTYPLAHCCPVKIKEI